MRSLISTKMHKHTGLVSYCDYVSSYCKVQSVSLGVLSMLSSLILRAEKKKHRHIKEAAVRGMEIYQKEQWGRRDNTGETYTLTQHYSLCFLCHGTTRSGSDGRSWITADLQDRAPGVRWNLYPVAASSPQRKLHHPQTEVGSVFPVGLERENCMFICTAEVVLNLC